MKSLVVMLIVLSFCGLNHRSRSTKDESQGKAVVPTGRLDDRIGPADRSKYGGIQDASDWKNPFLTIKHDAIEVRYEGGTQVIAPDALAKTLIALPVSSWPYGRVIAVVETGLRRPGDTPAIQRNLRKAKTNLRSLGLEISSWPSA